MFVAYLSSVLTPSISCETAAVVISTWERFTVLVDGYRCEGEAQGRSGLLQWNCQVVMVESGGSPSGTCGRVWNKDPARPRARPTVPGHHTINAITQYLQLHHHHHHRLSSWSAEILHRMEHLEQMLLGWLARFSGCISDL